MNGSRRRPLGALVAAASALIAAVAAAPPIAGQRIAAGGVFREVATPLAASAADGRALRSRSVMVDVAQIAAVQRVRSAADAAPRLMLNLFPDTTYQAVLDRIDLPRAGFVWVGHVPGVADSSVTLAVEGDVMAGSVVTPEATFTIRYAGTSHIVAQMDQSAYPPELPPLVPASQQNLAGEAVPAGAAAGDAINDDGSTIDVMVLYTPAVTAYNGSHNAVRTLVNLGVSETNTSYVRSGVAQRLRLVYTGQVGYTESGNLSSDLSTVTNSFGALNGVAALRNAYAADLVSLWVHYPQRSSCGVAWVMTSITTSFAPNGYSVTDDQCVSPNYTFGHELGHNMGAGHDWFVDTRVAPRTYAHGYVYAPGRWRTMMAYNDLCAVQQFNCTRLLAWATPTLTHNGVPMGVGAGTSTGCSLGNTANPPCDADDARLLNETAFVVANFRQGVPAALAVSALTPSVASPSTVNTTVSWTAATSGGTGPFTYKFIVFDGANWTVAQDWSASNVWNWTPAIPSAYSIQVWVRNAGSSALYDAWGQADYFVTGPPPLVVTTLTASPGTSAPLGVNVSWTALVTGGTGPYTYKFVVYDGLNWTIGRDWSASNNWLWSPPGAGTYSLQVWVRNAGSVALYDAWLNSGSYLVTPPPPLTVTSLASTPSSSAATNTAISWSSAASGGAGPYTYKFLLWNGSSWAVGQDWSAAATWMWTPTVAGIYSAQVWARNAGSNALYDAWRGSDTFTVTGPAPLSITSLSPSPASGVVGQAVLWNTAATGGSGPYTYKFLIHDGATWSVGRDWSTSGSWSWTPSAAGTYSIQVWARNAGSANSYDAWLGSALFVVANMAPAQLGSILERGTSLTIGAPAMWQATGAR